MLKPIERFLNRREIPNLNAWKRATQHRAQSVIRDWQMANRIVLSKQGAEDLANRFASALTDAVAVGAMAATRKAEQAAME